MSIAQALANLLGNAAAGQALVPTATAADPHQHQQSSLLLATLLQQQLFQQQQQHVPQQQAVPSSQHHHAPHHQQMLNSLDLADQMGALCLSDGLGDDGLQQCRRLPSSYLCHLCFQKGHHIKDCPSVSSFADNCFQLHALWFVL